MKKLRLFDILAGVLASSLIICVFYLLGYHHFISSFQSSPLHFLIEERNRLKNGPVDSEIFKKISDEFSKNPYCSGFNMQIVENSKIILITPKRTRDWFEANPQKIYILDCKTFVIISVIDNLKIVVNSPTNSHQGN